MALNKKNIWFWWENNNNNQTEHDDTIAALELLSAAGYNKCIISVRNYHAEDIYTELMSRKPAAMRLYGGLKTAVYGEGPLFMADVGMDSLVAWQAIADSVDVVTSLTGQNFCLLDNETAFDPNNDGGMVYEKSQLRQCFGLLPRGVTYTSHPSYAWTTVPIWNKYNEVNRLMFREVGRLFRFNDRTYDSHRSVNPSHPNYFRRQSWYRRLSNIMKLRPSPNRRRRFQVLYFFGDDNPTLWWTDAQIPTAMAYVKRTEDALIYPGSTGRSREAGATAILAQLATME